MLFYLRNHRELKRKSKIVAQIIAHKMRKFGHKIHQNLPRRSDPIGVLTALPSCTELLA